MTTQPATFHRNAVTGGPSVKGVECRQCGAYVGLVKSKGGRWYTCQLHGSLGENSQALVAYPFQPHGKVCGQAAREADTRHAERGAELRKAITDMEELAERLGADAPAHQRDMITMSIRTWRDLLVTEGHEAA